MQLIADKFDALASLVDRPPRGLQDLEILGMDLSLVESQRADELAAEHYDVLVHDMIPAASLFLEKDAMLGGAVSRGVLSIMDSVGYEPDTSSFSADHLVNELRFLSHLCRSGSADRAHEFVRLHMSSWLPILRSEWRRSESAFFVELERILGTLIVEICKNNIPERPESELLIQSEFDLENEKCSLSDISRFLTTTSESGLHMARKRLTRLARSLRLPAGFGSRARQIEGILRSAGQYDALTSVCDFLDEEIREMMQVWEKEEANDADPVPTPGGDVWAQQWALKLQATRNVVVNLRKAETV